MTYRLMAAALMSAFCLGAQPVAAQAVMSADEVAKVKAEVAAAAQDYLVTFSGRDLKGMYERIYASPSAVFGPNGAVLIPAEKTKSNYEAIYVDLAKLEYDHSDFKNPVICVLSANSAIASGAFQRYKKDGTLIAEQSAAFVYGKTPEGWRVMAPLSLQKNKHITCD